MAANHNAVGNYRIELERTGDFFGKLSPETFKDFASLQIPLSYTPGMILFSEKEPARGIFVVLDGEVKLSINSSEGKRLSLSIAKKGEILGLSSALSGGPYEMTAEVLYPARIAPIERPDFLRFMARHPEVSQVLMQEMSRQYGMACEQLRTVGLAATAPVKLARLLLDWSESGQKTEAGVRFRFSLTHEEIGEFIGASRETVTRTLSTFKTRHLVAFHGSMLTIPSRGALEHYANV